MSKKSYKRNQNRLYREIKRRILAENRLNKNVHIVTQNVKVDFISVKEVVSRYFYMQDGFEVYIKQDLARKIVNQLIADKYVVFYTSSNPVYLPIEDAVEIKATLGVVRSDELNDRTGKR